MVRRRFAPTDGGASPLPRCYAPAPPPPAIEEEPVRKLVLYLVSDSRVVRTRPESPFDGHADSVHRVGSHPRRCRFELLIDAHGAVSVVVSAALSLCAFAALLAALRPAPALAAERVA